MFWGLKSPDTFSPRLCLTVQTLEIAIESVANCTPRGLSRRLTACPSYHKNIARHKPGNMNFFSLST